MQRIPWRPTRVQPEYLEIPCQIEHGGFETERFFKLKSGHSGTCHVNYCTPESGPGFVLGQVVKRQVDSIVVDLPDGRVVMLDLADLECEKENVG